MLLSDDDMEKRRITESVLCYAAYCGSTPMVEALIQKGVGKKFSNENRNISVETGLILVTKMQPSQVEIFIWMHRHTQSALSIAELLLGQSLCALCGYVLQVQNMYKPHTTVT